MKYYRYKKSINQNEVIIERTKAHKQISILS